MDIYEDLDIGRSLVAYVIYKGQGRWYVGDKDAWLLTTEGYDLGSTRGLEEFIYGEIAEYEASLHILRERVKDLYEKRANIINTWEYMTDTQRRDNQIQLTYTNNTLIFYAPSLLIDCDNHILLNHHSEPSQYEKCVPQGWKGKYQFFRNDIPNQDKYWIVGETDYLDTPPTVRGFKCFLMFNH